MDCSSIFYYMSDWNMFQEKKNTHTKKKKHIETSNISIYNCRSRKLKVNVKL
jgi:hypothetical protein